MAITLTTPETKQGFIVNGISADASLCEELIAAVADKIIKIRHITMNNRSGGAITFTLGAGETADAVTDALIGPISIGANSSLQWDFGPKMELPVNTSLTIDTSGAADICIFTQGLIQ